MVFDDYFILKGCEDCLKSLKDAVKLYEENKQVVLFLFKDEEKEGFNHLITMPIETFEDMKKRKGIK